MNTKGLRTGLGFRGIIGAVVLGFICLYQPLFGDSRSFNWAKVLLAFAASAYVAFALIWDKNFLALTNVQFLIALLMILMSLITGKIFFVVTGLFAHALWDLWHLLSVKRYVPWWYAGACVYVDLAAVVLILIK